MMATRAWALTLGLVLVGMAGCLDAADFDEIQEEVHDAAAPALDLDPDATRPGVQANLRLIGYHNGFDDSGNTSAIPAQARFSELVLHENKAYLGHSTRCTALVGPCGGFSILDIEDPATPRLVGRYQGPSASDVEINAAGDLLFLGTQRNSVEEMVSGAAATQQVEPALPRGIHVVDVSKPGEPVLDSFIPLPYNGVHTLEYVQHPDTEAEYLIVATYDRFANLIPSSNLGGLSPSEVAGFEENPLTQRVIVFQIQDNPLPGPRVNLFPIAQFQILEDAPPGMAYWPHDTFVQKHPDGRVLLYIAYWDKGLQIVDFSDPADLQPVTGFTRFNGTDLVALHQVRAFDHDIAGRHVTVVEPEIVSSPDTGQITFLDTTRPEYTQQLSAWSQPNPDLSVVGLDNSPHNFDVADGTVLLSHYRLGVWAIDVSTEDNLLAPKTTGFYYPGPEHQRDEGPPSLWTAFWHEGRAYTVDGMSGLHILDYDRP